jgi:endonuclease YncB( thermonuclease family)
MYEYAAQVVRVIDGDTAIVHVDYGFEQGGVWSIRLLDLWCPERGTPTGDAATLAAQALLPAGVRVVIRTRRVKDHEEMTFARYLAHVELSDGRDFSETMIGLGHGTRTRGDS